MQPWTDRYPDRLAYELAEYERCGLALAPDQRELTTKRRLVMRGHVIQDRHEIQLTVVYPDSFPYIRPQVYASGLHLYRHQNPYDGNLCLLDRSTREWDTTNTGAWLITKRLPLLLKLLRQGGKVLHDAEASQGEPVTSYLATATGGMLLVTEPTLEVPEQIVTGTMRLGLGMPSPVPLQLRAALLALDSHHADGGASWRSPPADPIIDKRFSAATLTATWVRLPALPATHNPFALIEAASQINPAVARPRWTPAQGGAQIALLGLLVPEEVGHEKVEHSWVLVVLARPPGRQRQPPDAYLLRGERLTPTDLAARTPATHGMQKKTIAVAGTGTIGAPLVLELARAQTGELRLLDHDRVETGNTVRWPYGIGAVGQSKASFLARQIHVEYPLTHTIAYLQQLGAAPPSNHSDNPSEAATLTELLEGPDLLIDATGELGVSQLLADLARERDIPLISAWGTEGGWGGAVAVIQPDRGGCWFCLQLYLDDGTIPIPPAEPSGRVQPRGCAAPTFTATSYDMLEIVTQTMRCARRTLLSENTEPIAHICSTREPDGSEMSAPRWTSHPLSIHPSCTCCNATKKVT